ncbi:DUF2975 domain-containing protein [Photobacterium leiognathi]|uniref:DUF2975 domain-containing protein n=1 Tax=Photobacterium leiognathi TaxID=553611 RepID=UPI0027388E5C|nr:DUF2975 domain-containing protein [Photobacterium leiognathi]
MSKIEKNSRRVRKLFQTLLFLTPLLVIYFWLTVDTPYDYLTTTGMVQTSFDIDGWTDTPLTLNTRFVAMAVSLLLCSIIMYALKILVKLFKNYENNNIFTLENAMSYQKLGYCIFYWVGGGFLYQPIITLILTFNNPVGDRMIAISFLGIDFLTVLFGFIVLIISWVMKEGYQLADEQNYTI